MKPRANFRTKQSGGSLIEILVTLVILMIGLLGLIGLLVQSQRSQMESYQRVQALIMLDDMVNRINANRKGATSYVTSSSVSSSAQFLGTSRTFTLPGCSEPTTTVAARAACDLNEWDQLLLGSAETMASNKAGGILGARGCVELVAAGVYRVSVTWQGNSKTVAPAGISCATGQYGDDTLRRGVSVDVQITSLS